MLAEAVRSVLAQSYDPLELLIVDDGSTEDLHLEMFAADERVKALRTVPRGAAAARNLGIRAAAGTYVAFLDSDDLWEPGKLALQIRALEDECSAGLCYTDEIWLKHGKWLNQKKRHRKWSGWIFPFCLPLCIVSFSSAVIRYSALDAVGLLNEQLPVCEDYEYWIRLTLLYPVIYLEKKLVVKRGGHPDQLSTRYWGMDRFRIQALMGILGREQLTMVQKELVAREIERKCRIVAQGARNHGFPERADYYDRMASWAWARARE
jgi:glycosyltransferase involved in cell wall biosynthesis